MDQELKSYLDGKFNGIDGKFNGIDGKFNGIDGKFDGIDGKFDGIDGKFALLDKKFAALDEKFAVIDEKFAAIDAKFDGIDAKFTAMDAKFNAIDGKIERLAQAVASEVGTLHLQIQQSEQRLGVRLDSIDSRLKLQAGLIQGGARAMARFSAFSESSEERWVALLSRVEVLERKLERQ